MRGDLINAIKYLKCEYQEDGTRFSSVVPRQDQGQWAYKLEHEMLHLNMSCQLTQGFSFRFIQHEKPRMDFW